ncbi:hypothetical protein KKB44_04770 [Candidatus Micrarchaeota archaeon]|nr:hypothetical protein [Candidatus Micrarchaeota archaeon]
MTNTSLRSKLAAWHAAGEALVIDFLTGTSRNFPPPIPVIKQHPLWPDQVLISDAGKKPTASEPIKERWQFGPPVDRGKFNLSRVKKDRSTTPKKKRIPSPILIR